MLSDTNTGDQIKRQSNELTVNWAKYKSAEAQFQKLRQILIKQIMDKTFIKNQSKNQKIKGCEALQVIARSVRTRQSLQEIHKLNVLQNVHLHSQTTSITQNPNSSYNNPHQTQIQSIIQTEQKNLSDNGQSAEQKVSQNKGQQQGIVEATNQLRPQQPIVRESQPDNPLFSQDTNSQIKQQKPEQKPINKDEVTKQQDNSSVSIQIQNKINEAQVKTEIPPAQQIKMEERQQQPKLYTNQITNTNENKQQIKLKQIKEVKHQQQKQDIKDQQKKQKPTKLQEQNKNQPTQGKKKKKKEDDQLKQEN